MTTRVTITHDPNQQHDKIVCVATVTKNSEGAHRTLTMIPPGASREFYLFDIQTLEISEISKDPA